MANVTIRIPMPLRDFTGNAAAVTVEGRTVADALEALAEVHGGLRERVLTPEGQLRGFVHVFKGEDDVSDREGLATRLADGDELAIIPAVAGGAGKAKDRRLAALRESIAELSPAEALQRQSQGAALIDVRERDEIAGGSPSGAHRLGRGYLELKVEETLPELDQPIITMCDGGTRSLFAAEDLHRLGYTDVHSMRGGFSQWKDEGLPVEVPPMLSADARARYSRHLLMPEVGETGQLKLLGAKVLLVGAGGLGSPAAMYLAAAGVGTIGLVDHDVVDRSNLQRQILHTDDSVGTPKVDSAKATLHALNPSVTVNTYAARLSSDNVEQILQGCDVVVDGSDNFATRYLVNDACVKLGLPNVHGAVYRFEGQASVFWPAYAQLRGPCYRCIFAEPPPPELAPSCAEAGVLGILPGVIGLLEAVEAIKIILGVGTPLVGKLLYYNALDAHFTEVKLKRDPECPYCGDGAEFPGYIDYEAFCAAS